MGSPLAPVLTEIFMGFMDLSTYRNKILKKRKFSLRFVDDFLAAFDKFH